MFSLTYTPWFRKLSSSKFHNCGNTNYVAGEQVVQDLYSAAKINLFRFALVKFENHETYPEAPEEISRTSVTCCLATVRVWSPSILFVELIFNTFLKLNRISSKKHKMSKLFVYGVNSNCPRETLEAEFARCGEVTDVYITEKGYVKYF